jgi:hypothetical protein
MCDRLAAARADVTEQRAGKEVVVPFGERCPGFDLHLVLGEDLLRRDLLAEGCVSIWLTARTMQFARSGP